MPLTTAEIERIRGSCVAPEPLAGCTTFVEPAFYTWLADHGKSVYARYVVRHPGYALIDPLRHASGTVGDVAPISAYQHVGSSLSRFVERWLTPSRSFLLWPMLLLAGAALALVALVARTRARAHRAATVWLTAVVLLSLLPHVVITWDTDAMEQVRHALTATIVFRVAVLVSFVLLADAMCGARSTCSGRAVAPASGAAGGEPTSSECAGGAVDAGGRVLPHG